MSWNQYHNLYGDIYRFHKKYNAKPMTGADADAAVAEANEIYCRYGQGSFVFDLIEAVLKDLYNEPPKGWTIRFDGNGNIIHS